MFYFSDFFDLNYTERSQCSDTMLKKEVKTNSRKKLLV